MLTAKELEKKSDYYKRNIHNSPPKDGKYEEHPTFDLRKYVIKKTGEWGAPYIFHGSFGAMYLLMRHPNDNEIMFVLNARGEKKGMPHHLMSPVPFFIEEDGELKCILRPKHLKMKIYKFIPRIKYPEDAKERYKKNSKK